MVECSAVAACPSSGHGVGTKQVFGMWVSWRAHSTTRWTSVCSGGQQPMFVSEGVGLSSTNYQVTKTSRPPQQIEACRNLELAYLIEMRPERLTLLQ